MLRRLLETLSSIAFTLGGVWLLAAILRLIFGVSVLFPLLPPLALERVAVTPALVTAFVYVVVGAWCGRLARSLHQRVETRRARANVA